MDAGASDGYKMAVRVGLTRPRVAADSTDFGSAWRGVSVAMRLETTDEARYPVDKPTIPSPLKTVLLVDDQNDSRTMTKWFLANFGYSVVAARSAEEALALFDPKLHDVVVTDNSMPGITGVEMAHIIKLRSPETPIVMYTGLAPTDRSCLDEVIQRPTHLLALKEAVDRVVAARP